MTVQEVRIWPDPALKEVASPVEDPSAEEIQTLIQDLKDTMKAYNAEGVAATQLGVAKRVICVQDEAGQPTILINPRIDFASGEVTANEGCLSFPGVSAKVTRFSAIDVIALNEQGEELAVELHGMPCVAVQHELDHLDGKVMLDHLGPTARRLALKRLKKVSKRTAIRQRQQEKSLRRFLQMHKAAPQETAPQEA